MPAQKRSAPGAEPNGSRRRSGRISNTPQKSKYFEDRDSEDEEEEELPPTKRRGRPAKKVAVTPAKEESDDEEQYKDETGADDDDDEDDDVVEEEEEEDDEDESTPPPPSSSSKKRGRPAKKQKIEPVKHHNTKKINGKFAAKTDDKNEDEDEEDEDAPMKVEIIPLEKMRDTGGVEYADEKVHNNTLLFLKDLKANNQRPWLKSHDGEYRRSLKDWQSFVEETTQTVIGIDETVPELPAKDVIFRIHRDVRFSKNPTPYKPHFSAAWSRTGRKGPYAVYYIHCEPKASFIGGGLWCPEAGHVAKLRNSINDHPRRWRRALNEPLLKAAFFPDVKNKNEPEAAVKAFVAKNQEYALKKRPMGYEVTHRDIELLKLKSYTVGAKVDDKIFCGDDAQAKIADMIRGLFGYITFLNGIVMPDPNAADDDSETESEDEEEEEEDEE